MHTTTNGQNGQHKLERYTEDTTPTTPAPPPHSVFPPEVTTSDMIRVLVRLALVLVALLYVGCIALMFVFFRDNWYQDEEARTLVAEGLAILVVGIGAGIAIGKYKRKDSR